MIWSLEAEGSVLNVISLKSAEKLVGIGGIVGSFAIFTRVWEFSLSYRFCVCVFVYAPLLNREKWGLNGQTFCSFFFVDFSLFFSLETIIFISIT